MRNGKTFARRLRRLEQAVRGTVEDDQPCALQVLLDKARLRCGIPPRSPERMAELSGLGVVEILHEGRSRCAQEARAKMQERT
jgi:hypothetical protein